MLSCFGTVEGSGNLVCQEFVLNCYMGIEIRIFYSESKINY